MSNTATEPGHGYVIVPVFSVPRDADAAQSEYICVHVRIEDTPDGRVGRCTINGDERTIDVENCRVFDHRIEDPEEVMGFDT